MLIAAVETSARPPSVAVRLAGTARSAALALDRPHASDLLSNLDELIRSIGARPSDLRAVIVGTGPGSYTGLRVGIATALGLSRGSGAVLRGVPSGETIAFAALEPGMEGVVLIDARQEELYFAHYRRTEDEVETLRAPCVLTAEEVAISLPESLPIFGDAAAADAARLTDDQRARLRPEAAPSARALLELGARRLERIGPQSPSAIEPLYLRPFAARQRRR
jgi:tRNA threonylcarbamoyladenosine biosynthesis protein TsaB